MICFMILDPDPRLTCISLLLKNFDDKHNLSEKDSFKTRLLQVKENERRSKESLELII